MPLTIRRPDAARRDRFVRAVAQGQRLFVVSGAEGLARAPCKKFPGRETTFVWSERAEAERWASVVADQPRVKEIALAEVLSDLLPGLERARRAVGSDWTTDDVEPEDEPAELAQRLRLAVVDRFIARVIAGGRLFVLEDGSGLALVVSSRSVGGGGGGCVCVGGLVLPCWADRDTAEQRLVGPFAEMFVTDVSLQRFETTIVPWLAERGHALCPEHDFVAGGLEISGADLLRRLQRPVRAV
ncbi:MAG: DUF2750 domain-containing protein [Hyphomicrobiaceae bacterium]|nr:DUF2750 domain-containing protein [Hyphomicrobiaceae bacterium]